MSIDVYVIGATNLREEERMYVQVESFAMGNSFLIGKTRIFSEKTQNPSWDLDERRPFKISILRAKSLRLKIFRKNKIFSDDLLYSVSFPLIEQKLECDIPLELKSEIRDHDKTLKKMPTIHVKIISPNPVNEYTDWHPSYHSIYACLSFTENFG